MCSDARAQEKSSNGRANFFEKWDIESTRASTDDIVAQLEGDESEDIELEVTHGNEIIGELHPHARKSLSYLHTLEKLNPVVLKQEKHMTAEDREKVAAFDRSTERRKEAIKNRCNFYEIYRNKDFLGRETFNELIARSLAKTPDADLPTEFQPYAKFLKKYEEENPGKYLIASQFGRNLAGADPSDLMSRNDYNEAFGENDWMLEELESGRIPAELQKAMKKYTDRIQR